MSRDTSLGLIGLVIAVYALLACFRLGSADLGADEGRFGISAMNILADHRQFAIVSEKPLGEPGWKPYLYPLVLAGSLSVGGKTEFALRIVNVAAVAASALCLYYVARAFLPKGGAILAALFLLLNPGSVKYARTVMPEPWVLLSGCVALAATCQFWRRPGWIAAAATGIALGAGFLTKLWLVAPFALACAILFLHAFIRTRDPRVLAASAVGGVSFVAVSASHVAASLVLAPEAVAHWREVYFFHYVTSRVGGAGYDPAMWYRPWWFYLAALFKFAAFGLPFVMLGAYRALRDASSSLAWIGVALLSPVLLFAPLKVKQASYIIAAFPAVALLFAMGALVLWEARWTPQGVAGPASPRPRRADELGRDQSFAVAVALSMVAACLALGVGAIGRSEAGALILFFAAQAAVFYLPSFPVSLRRRAVVCAALAGLLVGDVLVIRQMLQFRTHYREISAYFKERLSPLPPTEPAFLAPEFPSMEFYTFRRGEYRETYYVHTTDAAFSQELAGRPRIFYVVDPSQKLYGSGMSTAKLAALRGRAIDVTDRIERSIGERLPLRVFVPSEEPRGDRAPESPQKDEG